VRHQGNPYERRRILQDVRNRSESRLLLTGPQGRRSANFGLMHRSKGRLFDQLVRDAEQTRGDGEPERLGSTHVNGQLEFGRLQNRQIGRFFAH
jgi:hypothetical protein